MESDHAKSPSRRQTLSSRPLSRLPRRHRQNPFPSPLDPEERKYLSQREAERNIGQNISLIAKKQEGSFISNRQDRSLDSFDKMLMGVDEELDIEDQNASNSKENDPNYTLLYHEFERLVKHAPHDDPEESSLREESRILKEEAGSSSLLREEEGEQGKREGREETRGDGRRRGVAGSDPNISLRLLGANLSEIHQEEIQHSSMHRMDPIEQEFIDFVGKNEAGRVNISNIEKLQPQHTMPPSSALKHELNASIKEPEEDEVVAMLENELGSRREALAEQESMEEGKKPQIDNYQQILRQLDENEDKKDISHLSFSGILAKREEWVNNRPDRSMRWKAKELHLIAKIREILFNPYAEFSDEEDFNLSL